MSSKSIFKFDFEKVWSRLRRFQQRSALNAFRHLYLDESSSKRFLVADEVGLGKTVVARGVIGLAIKHLRKVSPGQRIDVIYICSNSEIAKQNISRLNVSDEANFQHASRITLLPTYLGDLKNRDINFVSFTPGTSFSVGGNTGVMDERILLFHMLKEHWKFDGRKGAYYIFQGGVKDAEWWVEKVKNSVYSNLDAELVAKFHEALDRKPDLKIDFLSLLESHVRWDSIISDDDRRKKSRLIGSLRAVLAQVCIDALEPDLIILDEFQKFKNLIEANDEDDEAAVLARQLFEYKDARILLLSATPYKMYTVSDEEDGDDHYKDFIETSGFLLKSENKKKELEKSLLGFRTNLIGGKLIDPDAALRSKMEVEATLKEVMSRTERVALTRDLDGMVETVQPESCEFQAADFQSYRALHLVTRELGAADTLEYWKSAPYVLNFMDNYDLKRNLRRKVASRRIEPELVNSLKEWAKCEFPVDAANAYQKVDFANARLRSLIDESLNAGGWKYLWMPPSLPNYKPEMAYLNSESTRFTKILAFSAWQVVPKSVSCVTSYEADRRAKEALRMNEQDLGEEYKGSIRETYWDSKKPGQLLKLGVDKQTGPLNMTTFALSYPSLTLARKIDPVTFGGAGKCSAVDAIKSAADQVSVLLEPILNNPTFRDKAASTIDKRWYWAAPLYLDRVYSFEEMSEWFETKENLPLDGGTSEPIDSAVNEEADTAGFRAHYMESGHFFHTPRKLGVPPPDLAEQLALIALGSPSVTSLRAFLRVHREGQKCAEDVLDCALDVAMDFRSLFNAEESVTLIRAFYQPGMPYWEQVLRYSVDGNLQAVLDEYVYVLRDSLSLMDKDSVEACDQISDKICETVSLYSSQRKVDRFHDLDSADGIKTKEFNIRCNYALAYGDIDNQANNESARPENVRDAFNSPFRPFVLVSTSVGQEGLDFHHYCHSIFHWNLPRNPIDLEQREGRVHRYKGHVVRKNVALKHAPDLREGDRDVWTSLFEFAANSCTESTSELMPYWIYDVEGGFKVRRNIPAIAMSREQFEVGRLLKTLALYRMVFGQPRQEDLLKVIESLGVGEIGGLKASKFLIDLSPPSLADLTANLVALLKAS